MPRNGRDALSGYNRACVEWQRSALMTQGRPRGSGQKELDVLVGWLPRRPYANLSAPPDLEICNVFYPDKGMFGRVLKHKSACTFRYRGMASRNLNHDVEILSKVHGRWHAG